VDGTRSPARIELKLRNYFWQKFCSSSSYELRIAEENWTIK